MEFVFQQAERRLLITFFGNIKVEETSRVIEIEGHLINFICLSNSSAFMFFAAPSRIL